MRISYSQLESVLFSREKFTKFNSPSSFVYMPSALLVHCYKENQMDIIKQEQCKICLCGTWWRLG